MQNQIGSYQQPASNQLLSLQDGLAEGLAGRLHSDGTRKRSEVGGMKRSGRIKEAVCSALSAWVGYKKAGGIIRRLLSEYGRPTAISFEYLLLQAVDGLGEFSAEFRLEV